MRRSLLLLTVAALLFTACGQAAVTATSSPGGTPTATPNAATPATPGPSPRPTKAAPARSAYGVAGNGSIAYDFDGDIYLADSQGNGGVAIITGPEIDGYPDFSNDGTRIAFSRDEADGTSRLMVANADGSDVQPLTGALDEEQWREWSPDGRFLVFSHEIDGKRVLSIVATDGSGTVRQLDTHGVTPVQRARWRPNDGRELIFTGRPQSGGSVPGGLYAIAPDGTGLREIGSPWTDESSDGVGFHDFYLSPDGSTVAYWRWEANEAGVIDAYAHFRDLTTGADRRVESYFAPRYSPDGLVVGGEAKAPGQGQVQVVIAPADASQPGRPIGATYSYLDRHTGDFGISPDGTKVWLILGGVVWIIDIETGEGAATQVGAHPSWQRVAP